MDEDRIVMSHFVLELTEGFQKRLALNIPYGAAYFNNRNPGFLVGKVAVKPAFDFVGDMRDHLNRTAAVVAPAFLLKYAPVNFSGGYV